MLRNAVTLAIVDESKTQCVYTDASMFCWSVIVTQCESDQLELPLQDQSHEPLCFLSGTFKGASSRWSIVDKEAFALVTAVRKCAHLLISDRPFHAFADHSNLLIFFGIATTRLVDGPRYRSDRLTRWITFK